MVPKTCVVTRQCRVLPVPENDCARGKVACTVATPFLAESHLRKTFHLVATVCPPPSTIGALFLSLSLYIPFFHLSAGGFVIVEKNASALL